MEQSLLCDCPAGLSYCLRLQNSRGLFLLFQSFHFLFALLLSIPASLFCIFFISLFCLLLIQFGSFSEAFTCQLCESLCLK